MRNWFIKKPLSKTGASEFRILGKLEGFADTFRQSNPDILDSTLGHTWTTVGTGYQYISGKGIVPVKEYPQPEYRDPYTRIDYIYALGSGFEAVRSRVISHHRSQAERSFPEFPSDHAAQILRDAGHGVEVTTRPIGTLNEHSFNTYQP